jgi:hypothetical protein
MGYNSWPLLSPRDSSGQRAGCPGVNERAIIGCTNTQLFVLLCAQSGRHILKGAGTLVDELQLSYCFHQNCSKLGTAITEDHKNL